MTKSNIKPEIANIIAAIRLLSKEDRQTLWREWKKVDLAELLAAQGLPPTTHQTALVLQAATLCHQ